MRFRVPPKLTNGTPTEAIALPLVRHRPGGDDATMSGRDDELIGDVVLAEAYWRMFRPRARNIAHDGDASGSPCRGQ